MKRALATVSGGNESPSPQPSPSPSNRLNLTTVAYPKESDKQKLGYLLRTSSAGSSITSSTAGDEETVTRRKIVRRKSSSSSDEDVSVVSRSSKGELSKTKSSVAASVGQKYYKVKDENENTQYVSIMEAVKRIGITRA